MMKRPLKQLVDLPLIRFLSLESFFLANLLFGLKDHFLRNSSLTFHPSISFFLKFSLFAIHLKLLKIASNHPQLFFQLADLLLLRLRALHRALVLGLEVGEPSKT